MSRGRREGVGIVVMDRPCFEAVSLGLFQCFKVFLLKKFRVEFQGKRLESAR